MGWGWYSMSNIIQYRKPGSFGQLRDNRFYWNLFEKEFRSQNSEKDIRLLFNQ
jgi:hypothetical protein